MAIISVALNTTIRSSLVYSEGIMLLKNTTDPGSVKNERESYSLRKEGLNVKPKLTFMLKDHAVNL
jgi:hypothetical protein